MLPFWAIWPELYNRFRWQHLAHKAIASTSQFFPCLRMRLVWCHRRHLQMSCHMVLNVWHPNWLAVQGELENLELSSEKNCPFKCKCNGKPMAARAVRGHFLNTKAHSAEKEFFAGLSLCISIHEMNRISMSPHGSAHTHTHTQTQGGTLWHKGSRWGHFVTQSSGGALCDTGVRGDTLWHRARGPTMWHSVEQNSGKYYSVWI